MPSSIAATFMGAHEIPAEYRERPDAYVDARLRRDDPGGRARRARRMVRRVLRRRRVHAGGIDARSSTRGQSGRHEAADPRRRARRRAAGRGVAAAVGARSADHLIFVDAGGAQALAAAGIVATLLPSAAFYLKLGRFAPARMLIDASVAVALATDVNPGGGFSPSMPFAMTLGCFAMGLTFEKRWSARR